MINFNNATVLSYSHTPQFLGNTLRYKITKNLSVEGLVLNLTNLSGISGTYSGINSLLSGVNDYDYVIINGQNFGQGKILDFSFDRDDATHDVRYKKYRASIIVYDSGNLFNVFSGYYSGINWNNAQILDSFDEDFSYTRNEDNTSQYSQSVNLRFNSGQNLPFTPIQLAQIFASGFFNAINLTGFLGESYNKPYKKFYTETYNQIDNSCSFKQNCEFPAESGVYAITYNHRLNLAENGITTVEELGSIKGLYDPVYSSLEYGLAIELPNAFNRCSGVFNFYAPSGAYSLNQNPSRKNINLNKFEGTANFEVAYTNDPRYQNIYVWEYTTTIDRNLSRVYTISENGKVDGIGRRNLDKFPNAQIGYSAVKTGILSRVSGVYTGVNPYPLNLNLISSSEGFSHIEGDISYNYTYNDDITSFPISGIRQFGLTINDKVPTQLINKFNILNFKELVQPANQSTLGQRNINISMVGNRNLPISGYLNYASGQLTGYKNVGTDIWTNDLSYNYNPIKNSFDLSITYLYDGDYKSFTDIMYKVTGI